jgi:hypothetical protein
MSKSLKNRLEKIEEKNHVGLEDAEELMERQRMLGLLGHYEFLMKEAELTMSPEEIQVEHEKSTEYVLAQYAAWLKISPEEQEQQGIAEDKEIDEDNRKFAEWKAQNPEEYKRIMGRDSDVEAITR